MHEIIEGLYLGGLLDATNRDLLQRAKVVAVVNCCTPFEIPLSARLKGLEYFSVDVEDVGREQIDCYFHPAAEFIDQYVMKKEAVLIHCKSGVSRSATVTIAYLVIKKNFDLQEAFFHVRAKRDIICPNIGFMSQLCHLESQLADGSFSKPPSSVEGLSEPSTNVPNRSYPLFSTLEDISESNSSTFRRSCTSPISPNSSSSSFESSNSEVSSESHNQSQQVCPFQCPNDVTLLLNDSFLNESSSHQPIIASIQIGTPNRTERCSDGPARRRRTGNGTPMCSASSPVLRDIFNSEVKQDSIFTHQSKIMRKRRRSSSHPKAQPVFINIEGIEEETLENKRMDMESIDESSNRNDIPKQHSVDRRRIAPSICLDKYIDWYLADSEYRAAVPDLDP